MAYGNWSAIVYLNGKRCRDREHQTPYKEKDFPATYWQKWVGLINPDLEMTPVHADLGSGRVRVCGYKDQLCLYLDGKLLREGCRKYISRGYKKNWTNFDEIEYGKTIKGEIKGVKFEATHSEEHGNIIHIKAWEPNGDFWEAFSGYHYDDNGNEFDVEKKYKHNKEVFK